MNKKYFATISLIIILINFTKCTADKRIYKKGYHIAWHKAKSQNKLSTNTIETENNTTIENPQDIESEDQLYTSNDKTYQPLTKKVLKQKTLLPNDSCGDIIIMKNGDEVAGKVFEINDRAIKYKKCNNLNGPLFVASAETVFMIKYANGTKEVIKKNEPVQLKSNSNNKPNDEKKTNTVGLISFILSCLFFTGYAIIPAFILALIARRQITYFPDLYKNKWMYKPGIILGWITIISILVFYVLFLILSGII
jgi:hypothetical protein